MLFCKLFCSVSVRPLNCSSYVMNARVTSLACLSEFKALRKSSDVFSLLFIALPVSDQWSVVVCLLFVVLTALGELAAVAVWMLPGKPKIAEMRKNNEPRVKVIAIHHSKF